MNQGLTTEDLKIQLKKVILPTDKNIVVYSGLWTFGHRFKKPVKEVPSLVLKVLEEVVGQERNLFLPTYTYIYNKTRRFDIRSTKPETGILPELYIQSPHVERTHSAISSFGVRGPDANHLKTKKGVSIWGKGSLIEWFDLEDARIITLGLPWHISCGYFHRVEEAMDVPYRFLKNFKGRFIDESGIEKNWEESMFVRSLHIPSIFDWDLLRLQMQKQGSLLQSDLPGLQIESDTAHSIVEAGKTLLEPDPYALIVNKHEVIDWVKNGGKDKEIEETLAKES